MPPTPKAVLISLADNANDQGVCWPSIETISMRTCFSERAVQNAIKWLEQNGLLRAERANGRSTNYVLTPGKYVSKAESTPAGDAPPPAADAPRSKCTPQEMHPAGDAQPPAGGAPPPPQEVHQPPQEVHPNRKEPPFEPSQNRNGSPMGDGVEPTSLTAKHLSADGVEGKVARDWLTLRKAKRLPLTPTAWDTVKVEAAKVGMTPAEAVKHSVDSNWAGFKASWVLRERTNAGGSATGGQTKSGTEWWETASGISARGAELEIKQGPQEAFPYFKARVFEAAGDGPWIWKSRDGVTLSGFAPAGESVGRQ